jgi:hypothetical protein
MKKILLAFLLVLFVFTSSYSQQKFSVSKFITPADSFNKHRFWAVNGACAGTFGVAMIGLNYAWYANYPRSSFHFFNDDKEWLQMDKCGHSWTAYNEAFIASTMYQWAGVSQRKAAIYGAAWGFTLQLTIEILDGLSKEWGFSPGDATANTIGAGLFLGNELLWRDQRVRLKFSTTRRNYDDAILEQRANELYGKSLPERILKDYNAQSYWLSFNIASFLKKENHFPKWLNVAVGYGADNMFGALSNTWSYDINGKPLSSANAATQAFTTINRNDLNPYRQFFLSPDIDFTKIKTHHKLLKELFQLMNMIKFPAPTLEYNSQHQTKFHWLLI